METAIDYVFSRLALWAEFGRAIAELQRKGLVNPDLKLNNLAITTEKIIMIDFAATKEINYPLDWKKIVPSLMSLMRELEDDYIGAFRYGYIVNGGPISTYIFDYLRIVRNLNVYRKHEEVNYFVTETNLTSINEAISEDRNWSMLYKKYYEKTSNFREWFESIERRNIHSLNSLVIIDELSLLNHIIRGFMEKNIVIILEGILNLQNMFFHKKEYLLSYGLLKYCLYLTKICGSIIPEELIRKISSRKINNNLIDKVKMDNVDSASIDLNFFMYYWCLDDILKGNINRK
ncbi:hypothetical protein [Paenibacillus taichungensis]